MGGFEQRSSYGSPPPSFFFLLPTNVLWNIVDAIKGEMEIDEDSSDEEPAG